MVSTVHKGDTYTVKPNALSWDTHYNGKQVTALDSSGMFNDNVRVRCHCCDDTVTVRPDQLG